MELVAGVELGTHYFKAALFDGNGQLVGLGRSAIHPDQGDGVHCELPAEEFWRLLRDAFRQALQAARAVGGDIQAISYGSQANSFILLDEHNRPLTPLVLWPDRRARQHPDPSINRLAGRVDFLPTTGLGLFGPGFAAAKIRWFQRHKPHLWSRVQRVQTIAEHFVFELTGQHISDAGTASLLGLWDLRQGDWWQGALEDMGLSRSQLGSPQTPGTAAGSLTAKGASLLELPAGIRLAVGSLDHHAAAIGSGVSMLAPACESTGGVLACLRYLGDYKPLANCCMGPAALGRPGYWRLGFDSNGASTVEWCHRTFAPDSTLAELFAQAAAMPIGSLGLLARPSADRLPGLTGFLEAMPEHQPAHFVRAALESVAASVDGLLTRLFPEGRPNRVISTGGAARSDLWLQIKADVTGTSFVTVNCPETGCLGAAMLAAIAAGWFNDIRQAASAWTSIRKTVDPSPDGRPAYQQWLEHYRRSVSESTAGG